MALKVAFVQTNPVLGMKSENTREALSLVDDLDADLVVLPELFDTGYALDRDELQALAENPQEGETVATLRDYSKDRGMAIVAGFAESDGSLFYNSAVLCSRGEAYVYRKVHLFGREKSLFSPGSRFDVYRIGGVRIGVMVCFDWFFPESARTLMLKGADIIAHPANLVLPYWSRASFTRALENHVFIVTASRVGSERGIRFVGGSQIVSPQGEILARAGDKEVRPGVAEIDPNLARDKSVGESNHILKDRRWEAYELNPH